MRLIQFQGDKNPALKIANPVSISLFFISLNYLLDNAITL